MTQTNLTCDYCKHEFTSAKRYDNHYCEGMKRIDYLKTPQGKAALFYYKEWLRLRQFNSNIDDETFLESKYYSCFVRFILYSNMMMLPDKSSFIQHMVSTKTLPTFWTMNNVYVNYMENLDTIYPPEKQADATIKTMQDIASIYECPINEIFNYVEVGDCANLIKTRKLSPWLLLVCKGFYNYLSHGLTNEQRMFIQTVIKPSLWSYKFKKSPEIVKKMKEIANSYNL